MKRLYALTLLLSTTLATGALAAATTAAEHNIISQTARDEATSTDKVTSIITLNQTTADYILQAFGLNTLGMIPTTVNGTPAPSSGANSQIPAGIESIVPVAPGSSLVITGTRDAVDEMIARIVLLDVEPKTIEIVAEYYEIDPELDKEIAPLVEKINEPSFKQAVSQQTFKERLKAAGISPFKTASLSTLNLTCGATSSQLRIPSSGTSADEKSRILGLSLSATPRISEDNSITVKLDASFTIWNWDTDANAYTKHTHSLTTMRRAPSGEPFVAGGFTLRPGKTTIILITPTIVD